MRQIVAIDGPSGAGKSTLARALAKRLGYVHLDTGAMYRAVALAAVNNGVPLDDATSLDALCGGLKIELLERDGSQLVLLDGEDVTEKIRTPEMSRASSEVSAVSEVRRHMVRLQREIGAHGGVVAEGRDMGTVVFPDTPAKFYLDASPHERARRRYEELRAKGSDESLEDVLAGMERRDTNDSDREDSPLRAAKDAVRIDTTGMTREEVVKYVAGLVRDLEEK